MKWCFICLIYCYIVTVTTVDDVVDDHDTVVTPVDNTAVFTHVTVADSQDLVVCVWHRLLITVGRVENTLTCQASLLKKHLKHKEFVSKDIHLNQQYWRSTRSSFLIVNRSVAGHKLVTVGYYITFRWLFLGQRSKLPQHGLGRSGDGKGTRRACAPDGTLQGAAFRGQKYGILKFGCFWRIGVFALYTVIF